MKKRLKVLCMFIAVLSLTFSSTSYSFAAENYNQDNSTAVQLRAAICPNCNVGYMITSTTTSAGVLESSYVCSTRIDCLVRVYRYSHTMVTKCSNCGYGYTTNVPDSYRHVHSISH
jgi:uncharacterized protein (DUF983 family)